MILTENQKRAIQLGEAIVQLIYSIKPSSIPVVVDGHDLKSYFSNNYNPEKGETMQSEFDKWLNHIKTNYLINVAHDQIKDKYWFQHKFHIK